MTPDESLELLREAHREPIDDAHFAAVRARVMAEIAADRRSKVRRMWVLALAGFAAATLSLVFWPKAPGPLPPRRSLESREVGTSAAATTAAVAVDRKPASPRHAGRKPGGRPKGLAPQKQPEPLVVKMITDDPNVVIYWIAEGTGD